MYSSLRVPLGGARRILALLDLQPEDGLRQSLTPPFEHTTGSLPLRDGWVGARVHMGMKQWCRGEERWKEGRDGIMRPQDHGTKYQDGVTIEEPGRSPEVLQVVAMDRVICSSFLAHRKRFLQSCSSRFPDFTARLFWIWCGIRSTGRTAVKHLSIQNFTRSRGDYRGSGCHGALGESSTGICIPRVEDQSTRIGCLTGWARFRETMQSVF